VGEKSKGLRAAPSVPVATLVVAMLAMTACDSRPAMCEPQLEPTVSEALAVENVVGVVERETVASNPMPWGATISVATRIWGGIRADRWKVSERRFAPCPSDPPQQVGGIELDFRGADAEWGAVSSHILLDAPVGDSDLIELTGAYGSPVEFEIGGVDRFMARVRTWGIEITVLVVVVALLLVALLRRRRRRRYDRTLF
jgi:hypothetical protein